MIQLLKKLIERLIYRDYFVVITTSERIGRYSENRFVVRAIDAHEAMDIAEGWCNKKKEIHESDWSVHNITRL